MCTILQMKMYISDDINYSTNINTHKSVHAKQDIINRYANTNS